MTDNELLLAISDIMDKKTKSLENEMHSFKKDMHNFKTEVRSEFDDLKRRQDRTDILIENDIRGDIKLLAENYLPSAKRYEKSSDDIASMKSDIEILKKVVKEHSEKLNKVS